MKKKEHFDIYVQTVENMSDERVTIYTSPGNKEQIACMIMHLHNIMENFNNCDDNCEECDEC